ncbi:FKBP-type peptidyl-prolyl cis-trans isomerase [Bifidobacterium crudilactis]|jgi:peptidylprolyl isomerase|nr:FKBP-type peptidyl-prolyl cis-trans isomerase [Bifidobacterium crudilactis]MCI1868588.1 FKBP-type peptidyl-prolyl cis-trans isomerase [Bifidobacterium crudilactis]MDN6001172.1 FKBP-type peptidyl-prolyl cis-trans isomerase [Bifidobacterium crudilactis]MDN6468311.1 FKBP-type peptidyl-prolyl cis-trans isomerase [Bifidobacterium crudilactis]MDN6523159.1 FKBP-type peptidyl-prolyl cis-trans isomerase [Bifidobacterium crudilactis]MDN6559412.1 FKBP-type peptidyl-prolyl cis-trans isomerase [Bifidoba
MRHILSKHQFGKALSVCCALTMCLGLAACGSGSASDSSSSNASSSSSASSSVKLSKMTGVEAKGELGKKPTVSFSKPFDVQNNTYSILQEGNGEALQDGDRVCAQSIAISAVNGSELDSTWEKNTPDCSMVIRTSSMNSAYYNLLKGQKINTTIAFGIKDTSTSTATTSSNATTYLMVMTLVSKSKALTRAEGTAVTDIPSNLPKVTLDKTGKPSLDMNNYKPGSDMVVQTLIKGSGAEVKDTQTVSANYTGWLASTGKQFDSSWDKGTATDFSLSQVISGWKQGLAGQTVGSQVLLIIPPSLGYGSEAQSSIPANSTLVFVVDILAAY